jgi:hypothetical protein
MDRCWVWEKVTVTSAFPTQGSKMCKYAVSILLLMPLLFTYCKKQDSRVFSETDEPTVQQTDEHIPRNSEDIQPMGIYPTYAPEGTVAPDGKMIRVYNNETMETQWGPVYAPVIYLYDKENKELAKYNIRDLISEDFWGGAIHITYNNDRNSFDMVFSIDKYGNYGTAYIDLNTNQFIRELR